MTLKECKQYLGKIVLLNASQHLDSAVKVRLTKISLCADDSGRLYQQCEVQDKSRSIMYVNPGLLSEVPD